jgi:hypothetical protein
MATDWTNRWRDAPMPYQTWNPFPQHAIVQVANIDGDDRIGPASSFWWGWEANNREGVITKARRLDRPKTSTA